MQTKVILVYRDIEGEIAEESIWAQPVGDNYKVDNIPFYAPGLALNDIISVEFDEDVLYFDQLIQPSGYSTIQIIFFKENEIKRVLKTMEEMGCQWEGMKDQPYFAVAVPPNIGYKEIRIFLDAEVNNGILDFKEACLAGNSI